MDRRALILPVVLAPALASPAAAQTDVGRNIEGGLYWSVAAPQGAAWRLSCRFPPVTYFRNNYDQHAWINELSDQGAGPSRGRLPLDSGYCKVTKTAGAGPVAIAVGRAGQIETGAVRDAGQSVTAGLF